MRRLFQELKRRNVYRVGVTYVVVAVGTLQAARLVFPATTLRGLYDPLVVLAFVGFPLALVLAWAFELTPEGVRRTSATDEDGEDPGSGEKTARESVPGSRRALAALVGLGAAAGAVVAGWYLLGSGDAPPEPEERSVAVLPFQVSGGGADTWRDGMVAMLSTGLDGAMGFRAIPDRTVLAAWNGRREMSQPVGASTSEALSVARQVGARFAVVGSAVELGGRLRLVADLHQTVSGDRLGRVQVEGAPRRVTALADSLTQGLLGLLLQESGESIPVADLASRLTPSLPALEAFLEGERHYRAGAFEEAVEDYHRAVRRDSAFALAYWRVASASGWTRSGSSARHRRRAHELAHRLPRRERRLLRATWLFRERGQSVPALDSLRRLTSAYPDDPWVWYEFGEVILHAGLPGGWPEADRAFARAVELDPGHAPYHLHPVQLAMAVHRDSALTVRRAARHPNPADIETWLSLARRLAFGGPELRARALSRLAAMEGLRSGSVTLAGASLWHPATLDVSEQLIRKFPDVPEYRPLLVANLLRRGRVEEALAEIGPPPSGNEVACALADAMSLGLPLPDSVLRAHLSDSPPGPGASPSRVLCSGIYLMERGREEEVANLIARLRSGRDGVDASDPAREARLRDVADVLAGHRARRLGELERAGRLLSGAVHEPSVLVATSRGIWRGDVFRELGLLERAKGWYLANWWHPLAHQRLGRLHEEMGRPREAEAAYRRFIAGWAGADEGLQDQVDRARARLTALSEGASAGEG